MHGVADFFATPIEVLFRCAAWPEARNSVCIYISDTSEGLGPEKIVGIISRGDDAIIHLDPYLAVRRMAAAARDNWGQSAFAGAESYVYEKVFRRLPGSFSTALADAELALPPEVIAALGEGRRLYAISVDW